MKKLTVLLSIIIFPTIALAQPCPDELYIHSQAQLDSFQIIYPGCTEIKGDVFITGEDITNLNGLSSLTSIGGDLVIVNNPLMASLAGLDNLTSIGGHLGFSHNPSLTSLSALSNLTSIGCSLSLSTNALNSLAGLENVTSVKGLKILFHNNLKSLAGLEGLTSIDGPVTIFKNDSLTSLAGLENITSIGGNLFIMKNALTALSGLDKLTSIQGNLYIDYNDALTSLAGLDNINANSIDSVSIRDNVSLSDCEVLSLCNFLGKPDGFVVITGNAPGCSSPGEVRDSCIANNVSVEEMPVSENFSISPNPCAGAMHLQYLISDERLTIFDLFTIDGKMIRRFLNEEKLPGEYEIEIDVSDLPAGVYFVRMQAGDQTAVRRLVKID